MIPGVMFAFFSDIFKGSEAITAGTLDIKKGTVTVQQNDADVKTVGNKNNLVENFNPGDVVTVTVPVTNKGSKSAWIRGGFTLTGTAMDAGGNNEFSTLPFYVFDGDLTQAQAEAQKYSKAAKIINEGNGVYKLVDPKPAVISGDESNANLKDVEIETASTVPAKTAIYSGSAGTTMTYTIYFDPFAGNEWQNKNLSLNYIVEAIQYRNNPAPDWTKVETRP
jgi:hypothetical protein